MFPAPEFSKDPDLSSSTASGLASLLASKIAVLLKLFANPRFNRYLGQNHTKAFDQLRITSDSTSLER